MQYSQRKTKLRAAELYSRRFIDLVPIAPFDAMDSDKEIIHSVVPETIEGFKINLNDYVVGRDRYVWIRKIVRVPEPRDNCRIVGVFDFGETGGGFNSKFESTLYIDRKLTQSVDTFHNTAFLDHCAGRDTELTFLLWSGLEGGGSHVIHYHQVRKAHIGYLHMPTEELSAYLKAIAETLAILPDNAPEKSRLEALAENTLLILNFDSDKLYDTTPKALAHLKDALAAMEKHADMTVNVIGHTHIDVAWLWRFKHTAEKSQRSFATQLELMKEFPEFTFMSSQPQLYKYVKQYAPEVYEELRKQIAAGRWEPDGGMWVEADCNLTSGESLSRQFAHGIRFFKEEFGTDCTYLWLPDVFGYSWALPQIMKLCGIKTFMTTKIAWSEFDRMPHDLFYWRGIDGSDIMTYFMTTPTPGQSSKSHYVTYNDVMHPETIYGSWERLRDKNITHETLVSYGYGDGGGGVTREMILSRRAMDALPGMPNVKPAKPTEVFDRMHEALSEAGSEAPVWDGELYLEYHRGTYTTQSYNKKMNRKLEFGLCEGEWLSSDLAVRTGTPVDDKFFYDAWETMLLHQFHDVIPGSSIREVYIDSTKTYDELNSALCDKRTKLLTSLTAPQDRSYTLRSFASWAGGPNQRVEPVLLPDIHGKGFSVNGEALPTQETADGTYVLASIPQLGSTVITESEANTLVSAFSYDASTRTLTTPVYTAVWNEAGHFTSLKFNGREVLSGEANVLEVYEDKPLAHDAWDIDIYYTQKKEYANLISSPQIIEDGALRFTVRMTFGYNKSTFTQDITFYAHSARIDFKTNADWQEDHRLIKAAFPVAVRSTSAKYDIQYGFVDRPTHQNTSWDLAKFEVCAHKWADVSQNDFGVALLNDCKYGHNTRSEGLKGTVMRISLLKAPKHPDTDADIGKHTFTYALLPHDGTLTNSDVIAESTFLNIPVRITSGAADSRRMICTEGNVVVDAVKVPDGGEHNGAYVLRFHEALGGNTAVSISSELGICAYQPVDLLERPCGDKVEADSIKASLNPFEIKNYLVWFK